MKASWTWCACAHASITLPADSLMRDRFELRAPFGPIGWIVDRVLLLPYMRRLILKRNALLKQAAESAM